MISQLSGTVIEATASMVVLDVSGVGFELGISSTTAAVLPVPGGRCRLFTRLQVREDAMTLYGFATREERTMFEKLVAVSGVGPRLALAVLSTFSVEQLFNIVIAEDAKAMATVPGVGKKTAQRLILELKSVIAQGGVTRGGTPLVPGQGELKAPEAAAPVDEARVALLSMGFSSQEAELALDGIDGSVARVEDVLSTALKRLGKDA